MGLLYRLLPRKVRRARHPLRTARHRVTPRPIRRASYSVWSVRHPVRKAAYRTEDRALGRRRKRR